MTPCPFNSMVSRFLWFGDQEEMLDFCACRQSLRGLLLEGAEHLSHGARAEREEIHAAIAALEARRAVEIDVEAAISEVRKILGEFRSLFEGGALKEVVRRFVERVEIDYENSKATVYLRPISAIFREVSRGEPLGKDLQATRPRPIVPITKGRNKKRTG